MWGVECEHNKGGGGTCLVCDIKQVVGGCRGVVWVWNIGCRLVQRGAW